MNWCWVILIGRIVIIGLKLRQINEDFYHVKSEFKN